MSRVERWERNSEIPLLLLAVAFLIAYAWPVLNTSLGHDLERVLAENASNTEVRNLLSTL